MIFYCYASLLLLSPQATDHQYADVNPKLTLLTCRTARNPHDPARYTGGSSSGPAAIVASGLCSAALGTDGGGCELHNSPFL